MYQTKYLVLFWVSFVITLIWLAINVVNEIKCYYEYSNDYESYWSLADKSSTIEEKSRYVDMFVETLEKSGLQGQYNAIFYKTPDASFDKNLEALKSLQKRLQQIQTMDIKSFEYQTAIQQITAQEQGEAQAMLNVLSGTWVKNNYFMYWNWIGALNWFFWFIFLCVMIGFRVQYNDAW